MTYCSKNGPLCIASITLPYQFQSSDDEVDSYVGNCDSKRSEVNEDSFSEFADDKSLDSALCVLMNLDFAPYVRLPHIDLFLAQVTNNFCLALVIPT